MDTGELLGVSCITDSFDLKKTGSCSSGDILSLLGSTQMHVLKCTHPINTEEESLQQSREDKQEQTPSLWAFKPAEREGELLLSKSSAFSHYLSCN